MNCAKACLYSFRHTKSLLKLVSLQNPLLNITVPSNHWQRALKSGKVRGIVNVVGCSNPRVIYEKATVDIVDTLIKMAVSS